jgi:hypothetical protein
MNCKLAAVRIKPSMLVALTCFATPFCDAASPTAIEPLVRVVELRK